MNGKKRWKVSSDIEKSHRDSVYKLGEGTGLR